MPLSFFRIFILLSVAIPAAGQSIVLPKSLLLQRTIGKGGQDELLSMTTNWKGDIAAVGNAARGVEGGQDICFFAFDSQLSPLIERHIGRNGDDGVGQICTLPNGYYLIAGYSSRPTGRSKSRAHYFGKRDGWLLVLNEKGETVQELLLGTADDDLFVSVVPCSDGGAWVAGNSGMHAWIVRLSPDFKVLWEHRIQHVLSPTQITAATLAADGAFFVTGNATTKEGQQMWIAGFGKDGETILDKIYPKTQSVSGTGIVAVDAQSLAVVGTVNDPRERENGFVCFVDRTGVMSKYQSLGGREYDYIHSLTKLHNGQLLTAGGSASFERGSRRISAWICLLKKDGVIDMNQYYGSKLDDEALGLLEHSDGRLFAVGTTAKQVLKMRQGWLFQLTPGSNQTAPTGRVCNL